MTGLWQVNHRNSGDLSVQEIADSYYIHNWSLWLDLWILLRTVRVVLWGKGAY
jgi:lipopolysaccharide/colanic/teichoic acid biosynthesis glycosyltransferase